jgi:hypothetical protein
LILAEDAEILVTAKFCGNVQPFAAGVEKEYTGPYNIGVPGKVEQILMTLY